MHIRQDRLPKHPCACGCGEMIPIKTMRDKPMKFKNGHQSRGKNHPMWKGGEYIDDGYRMIWDPNHPNADKRGYVPEHVKVYTEYYGCCMTRNGVVHHDDEDKLNNSIENLVGMSRKQHRSHHNKGNQYGKRDLSGRYCLICKSTKTLKNKDNTYSWYKYENGWLCRSCYQKIRLNPGTNALFSVVNMSQ
jgi:hypothetical protein